MLVARLRAQGVRFVVAPALKYKGSTAEQFCCFFKDPSGNNVYLNAPIDPGGSGARPGSLAPIPGADAPRCPPPGSTFEPPKLARYNQGTGDVSKLSQSGRRSLLRTRSEHAVLGSAASTGGGDDASVATARSSASARQLSLPVPGHARRSGVGWRSARRAVSKDSEDSNRSVSEDSTKSLPTIIMRSRTGSSDDDDFRRGFAPRPASRGKDTISTSPVRNRGRRRSETC